MLSKLEILRVLHVPDFSVFNPSRGPVIQIPWQYRRIHLECELPASSADELVFYFCGWPLSSFGCLSNILYKWNHTEDGFVERKPFIRVPLLGLFGCCCCVIAGRISKLELCKCGRVAVEKRSDECERVDDEFVLSNTGQQKQFNGQGGRDRVSPMTDSTWTEWVVCEPPLSIVQLSSSSRRPTPTATAAAATLSNRLPQWMSKESSGHQIATRISYFRPSRD